MQRAHGVGVWLSAGVCLAVLSLLPFLLLPFLLLPFLLLIFLLLPFLLPSPLLVSLLALVPLQHTTFHSLDVYVP